MKEFFVTKIVWEHGSKYGDVFYPKTLQDLKRKIEELDTWGRERNYPFMIEASLSDGGHIGFTIAHKYSLVEFGYFENEKLIGPFYLVNPNGKRDEIIPIYYFGSYTEPDTTRMLPFQQVLNAVYFYVERRKFPNYIQFDSDDVNKKFVDFD